MADIVVDFDGILYKAALYGQSEDTPWERCGGQQEPVIEKKARGFSPAKAGSFVDAFMRPLWAAYDEIILAVSDASHTYWRHSVLPSYKGNRKGAERPMGLSYKDLWLKLPTECHPQMEADDVCSVYMSKGYECYSPDKDLKTVGGTLISMEYEHPECGFGAAMSKWSITGSSSRTDLEGFWFFCWQCLVGDSADGLPGCFGVGEKKADKLLLPLKGASKKAMWEAVVGAYDKAARVDIPLMQQAQVLRMKRSFDEPLWTPTMEGITFG